MKLYFSVDSSSPIKPSERLTSLHHHLSTETSLSNATEKLSSRLSYIFQFLFWLLHNVRKLKKQKIPLLGKTFLGFHVWLWFSYYSQYYNIQYLQVSVLSLTYSHRWLRGKESAFNTGDVSLIPGLGRSPGAGNGNSLQYHWLENSMDSRAWQATDHGVMWTGHDLATKPPPLPAAWSYSHKL